MGAILGVGLTDNPVVSRQDELWTFSLKHALDSDMIPEERKHPGTWPTEMREPWERDRGESLARTVRKSQADEFTRVRKAIDDFAPDAVIVVSKDHRESLDPYVMAPYWISAGDRVSIRPWAGLDQTPSIFGHPSDTTIEIPGSREISGELITGLMAGGFDPPHRFAESVSIPHAPANAIVHLDWETRAFTTPTIVLGVSPFGTRERSVVGLGPQTLPAPLPPPRAFELGAAIARTVLQGSRRIVLASAAGWSHANNTARTRSWLWPDVAADEALFAKWSNGDLRCVADLDAAELEEHGWWEHSIWAVLAGAMTEAGAELTHSSLQTNYLFNSNWVTSIFSPADTSR